jgi:hypothetical protein
VAVVFKVTDVATLIPSGFGREEALRALRGRR